MTQFASSLYPQTNPTNPILIAARQSQRRGYLDAFIEGALSVDASLDTATAKHARRVLTRLANLSG